MVGTAPLHQEKGTARRDRPRSGEEPSGRGKKGARHLKPAFLALIVLLLGSFVLPSGCGKKGPPFLAKKSFNVTVLDLRGERSNGDVVLTGRLSNPEAAREVTGCRVSYAAFPPPESPCETCPVEYTDQHDFGPEVIADQGFSCRIPGLQREYVYFLRLNLTGPGGASGPPSNQIRIGVGQ